MTSRRVVSDSQPPANQGAPDPARRRRGARAGRQKGCSIYIPGEQLRAAGIDPNGPAPYYRTWPDERGGIVVRLYKRP